MCRRDNDPCGLARSISDSRSTWMKGISAQGSLDGEKHAPRTDQHEDAVKDDGHTHGPEQFSGPRHSRVGWFGMSGWYQIRYVEPMAGCGFACMAVGGSASVSLLHGYTGSPCRKTLHTGSVHPERKTSTSKLLPPARITADIPLPFSAFAT